MSEGKMDKLDSNLRSLKRNNRDMEAMFTDFSTALEAMITVCDDGAVSIAPKPGNGKLQATGNKVGK